MKLDAQKLNNNLEEALRLLDKEEEEYNSNPRFFAHFSSGAKANLCKLLADEENGLDYLDLLLTRYSNRLPVSEWAWLARRHIDYARKIFDTERNPAEFINKLATDNFLMGMAHHAIDPRIPALILERFNERLSKDARTFIQQALQCLERVEKSQPYSYPRYPRF